MFRTKFTLIATDGKQIFGTSWVPNETKAVVCLIHGLGEHVGRYDHLARHLNKSNIAVYGIDQRGHGRSIGKRGHARCQNLWDDVESLMKEARLEHLDTPLFLYGHSWGGNVVSNFLIRRNTSELKGAILSAPWLQLSFEPSPFDVTIGRWMSRVYPAFTHGNKLNLDFLSRDPTVGEAYINDPLVHDKISAGLFTDAYKNGQYALDRAAKINLPVLVFHGTDDNITSSAASEKLSKSMKKSTFKLWPEMRHETHNEFGKEEVLDHVIAWILAHID